jgi:hypothetical protein
MLFLLIFKMDTHFLLGPWPIAKYRKKAVSIPIDENGRRRLINPCFSAANNR